MKFLSKIQNLPEGKKKIILWLAVIIIGLLLLALYIKDIQKRIKSLRVEKIKEELQPPEFKLPWSELPKINEEELKKLEEAIKEAGEIPQ